MSIGMKKKPKSISLSEIYIVRVFDWEQDEYCSWLHFTFAEAWEMFTELVEDMEAVFAGGMIMSEGHYYLAQTEEHCVQMCPFINEYDETETEDV